MITIKKIERDNGAIIYPDADFLADYKDNDFGSFISTIQVEALIGMSVRRLGDSDIYISLTPTGNIGEKGMEELKKVAKDILELSKEAIPKMTEGYAAFYQYFLEDFEKNGLVMPMVGKIF